MLEFNGKPLDTLSERLELLKYWMEERDRIRILKEEGSLKPWSNDWIFQQTYFCNVRREDDKVTRFIREYYSPHADQDYFDFNIALARFLNWPSTIKAVGLLGGPNSEYLERILTELPGKVFGDAYIVSTCGRAMPKPKYLAEMVLPALYEGLGAASEFKRYLGATPTLAGSYALINRIFGVQSFMAGQILADMKNTVGHPLWYADDWKSWATPGPGSQRGMSWLNHGYSGVKYNAAEFREGLDCIRAGINFPLLEDICNQDLQNCLCEFDKYCRVMTGTGRSKRRYNGA